MDLHVGDTVVYPHHGAAVIESIEKRTVNGEELDFLVLQIHQSDLTVRVPAKNAEAVGVRDVVGEEGLLKVFSVLRETDVEEAGNWSRRFKANQERLASGDVNKVSEVVRDLWRRDQTKGLSAGEKRMLNKARQILVGELALAQAVDDEAATEILEELDAVIDRQRGGGQDGPLTKARAGSSLDLDDLDDELDLDALDEDDDD